MRKEPEGEPGPLQQGWTAWPLSFWLSRAGLHEAGRVPPTPATAVQQGCVDAPAGAFGDVSAAKLAALRGGRSVGTGRLGRPGGLSGAKPGWN